MVSFAVQQLLFKLFVCVSYWSSSCGWWQDSCFLPFLSSWSSVKDNETDKNSVIGESTTMGQVRSTQRYLAGSLSPDWRVRSGKASWRRWGWNSFLKKEWCVLDKEDVEGCYRQKPKVKERRWGAPFKRACYILAVSLHSLQHAPNLPMVIHLGTKAVWLQRQCS